MTILASLQIKRNYNWGESKNKVNFSYKFQMPNGLVPISKNCIYEIVIASFLLELIT